MSSIFKLFVRGNFYARLISSLNRIAISLTFVFMAPSLIWSFWTAKEAMTMNYHIIYCPFSCFHLQYIFSRHSTFSTFLLISLYVSKHVLAITYLQHYPFLLHLTRARGVWLYSLLSAWPLLFYKCCFDLQHRKV